MLLFFCSGIFAEEQIVIESKLFRGLNQTIDDNPQEVIVSSFSTPVFVPEALMDSELKSGSITSLKDELTKVFQIQHIDHLISGNMIWNGKTGILKEIFSFDEFCYPVHISPEVISENNINLKIEMYRERNIEVSNRDEKVEKILDTEIVVNFDRPIIFGFPINGDIYFLSINLTRSGTKGSLHGEVVKLPNSTRIMTPPRTVYKFNPIYPIESRNKRIEGTVFLEVSTDTEGLVSKVRVLKSAHKDLDKAALSTLKQWRYEPVRIGKKPVNAVFVVAVDFKLKKISAVQSPTSTPDEKVDLETILDKCAEYCEKLSNSVLDFVCEETITEEIQQLDYDYSSTEINRFVYDYQLVRYGDSIDEKRILKEENGWRKNRPDAKLKTKRFYYKYIVLGPIGLLGRMQQKNIEYQILEEVTYNNEKAIILEALPKSPDEFSAIYGRIWIRKKDFNVLKIEWEQESMENFEDIEVIADRLEAQPKITFVSEYAYEKNGIRFPSLYSVEESYILSEEIEFNKSNLITIYDNYKFFTVETKVIY